MVTVTAKDINGDTIKGNVGDQRSQDSSMADDTVNGQLYIGAWEGKLDDQGNLDTNLTWADPAKLLSAHYNDGSDDAIAGLHDVAVFDAATSGYTGDINIAAEITEDSYDKYLKSVDGVKGLDKLAPVGGYNQAFTYATGSGDDVVNMTVNGDIAADVDFAMNIDTGAGNDLVAFRYDDMTDNESVNNKYLQQVAINTGAGDDHVWFYSGTVGTVTDADTGEATIGIIDNGGGVTVNAGSGADKIYVNQVDMMTGGTGSGVTYGPTNYNAVFVFNTNDPTVGVEGLNGATLSNNMLTGPAEFSLATAPASNVNLYVTVNFKGFSSDTYSSSNVLSKVSVASLTTTNYTVSAETINQAIINAVENDSVLRGLLSAKDGAGHGLIIESLANGVMNLDDLSITFYQGTSAADATLVSLVDSNAQSTDDWYATQFGTYAAADGDAFTGNDNGVHSQAVVNAGADNDLVVLGKNGEQGYGEIVATFSDTTGTFDLANLKAGNVITVTISGKDYLSTYDGTAWSEFATEPDPTTGESTTLRANTGLKAGEVMEVEDDATTADAVESGFMVTFTRTTEDSPEALDAQNAAIGLPGGTPAANAATSEGSNYSTTDTLTMVSPLTDGLTLTVEIDGTTYTNTYTAASTSWSGFQNVPDGTTITFDGTNTVTVTGATAKPTVAGTAQTATNQVVDEVTWTQEVTFDDCSTAVAGDTLEITFDTDGDGEADVVYTSTAAEGADGTVTFGEFAATTGTAIEGLTLTLADPLVLTAPVVTLTNTEENDADDANPYEVATTDANAYLGNPDATDGESAYEESDGNLYSNSGRDIVELTTNFGDDTLVDFVTGVDQINVNGLGTGDELTVGTATTLAGDTVFVGTLGTLPTSSTGIYTQTEVSALYTAGTIKFTGTEGTAVAFLNDGTVDADSNVYTVVQVTASAATVMGSLTLAADETIAAADLVGVSQLVDDPALASA